MFRQNLQQIDKKEKKSAFQDQQLPIPQSNFSTFSKKEFQSSEKKNTEKTPNREEEIGQGKFGLTVRKITQEAPEESGDWSKIHVQKQAGDSIADISLIEDFLQDPDEPTVP